MEISEQPKVYKLQFKGNHEECVLLRSVGGISAFTRGQVVETSNYSEVVDAIAGGLFVYLPEEEDASEEEAGEPSDEATEEDTEPREPETKSKASLPGRRARGNK